MRAIVYRFYDRDELLLYIGLTVAGPNRWGQHAIEQPWWPQVASVRVQHCDSIAEAAYVEREAIRAEHPRHNTIHAQPRRIRMPGSPRRPSGSGSVFQRSSDGRWVAQLSYGPRGARRTKTRFATSRRGAEMALVALFREPPP